MQPVKKSVVIVEDDRRLREQFLQSLQMAPDIKCLGAYASAEEAIPHILAMRPDVVLMEIKLPGMSGIQCVCEIKKVMPDILIIMVTIYEDSERIFRAFKAGANGYLVKSGPPDQLLASIRDVFQGGAPMSSHIARTVINHFHLIGLAPIEAEILSRREREVLDLLSQGCIYKEIADQLKIGSETVRTYVKKICCKMNVRGRMEAVARHRQVY